jgi:surface polysaccharide O-acyltransferase-like enzyme
MANVFIQKFISEGFTSIAVPLFFVISGFLFFNTINKFNSFKSFYNYKVITRIRSLVVPYIFWGLTGIMIFYILQSIPFAKRFFVNQPIRDLTFSQILGIMIVKPIPYALWFIRDLFVLTIFSPIIFYCIRYLNKFIKIIILIILLINYSFLDIPLYIFNNSAILFFSIGSYISLNNNMLYDMMPSKINVYFIFYLWLICLLINTLLKIYYTGYTYYHPNFISRTITIIGVFAFWFFYDCIAFNKMETLIKLREYTFIVYVAHGIPLLIFMKAFSFLSLPSLFIYIISPILTIILVLIGGFLTKQHARRFYNVITGGR